jgi:hypothetical protein
MNQKGKVFILNELQDKNKHTKKTKLYVMERQRPKRDKRQEKTNK